MPIRDHMDLMSLMDFFKLTNAENQSLTEFNAALNESIRMLIINQFKHNHPLFKPTIDTINTAKKHPALLKSNWASLKITLPDSIKALDGTSLIKLALHAQGEYLYKYLNDLICHEIFLIIKRCAPPELDIDSIETATKLSNTLSNTEINEYLSRGSPSKNELFIKIQAIFSDKFLIDKNTILYTDSNPLEFIGSTYISNVLRSARRNYEQPGKVMNPAFQKNIDALQWLAASKGSFPEAHNLTLSFVEALGHSHSLADASNRYNMYYTKLFKPYLLPRYQTVGCLLLFMMQLELIGLGNTPLAAELTLSERNRRKEYIQVQLYHNLESAKHLLPHCKNTLRLTLLTDNCQSYLALILPAGRIANPLAFKTIQELQLFLREQCPQLLTAFDNNAFTKPEEEIELPSSNSSL